MTRTEIAAGLDILVQQLANKGTVPDGWEPYLWAYVKGVASGAVLQLRDRLIAVDASTTQGEGRDR